VLLSTRSLALGDNIRVRGPLPGSVSAAPIHDAIDTSRRFRTSLMGLRSSQNAGMDDSACGEVGVAVM
jgi:hypothetical protein